MNQQLYFFHLSLKNFGKMFSFDFSSGDVGEFVKQFENLSAIQQQLILKSKAFNENQKNFLSKYAKTGASATTTFTGLRSTIKPLLATLAKNPLTWFVGLSAAAVALEDLFTIDYSEANEVLDKSIQKYEETKEAINSLNAEYKTNKEQMLNTKEMEKNTNTIVSNFNRIQKGIESNATALQEL